MQWPRRGVERDPLIADVLRRQVEAGAAHANPDLHRIGSGSRRRTLRTPAPEVGSALTSGSATVAKSTTRQQTAVAGLSADEADNRLAVLRAVQLRRKEAGLAPSEFVEQQLAAGSAQPVYARQEFQAQPEAPQPAVARPGEQFRNVGPIRSREESLRADQMERDARLRAADAERTYQGALPTQDIAKAMNRRDGALFAGALVASAVPAAAPIALGASFFKAVAEQGEITQLYASADPEARVARYTSAEAIDRTVDANVARARAVSAESGSVQPAFSQQYNLQPVSSSARPNAVPSPEPLSHQQHHNPPQQLGRRPMTLSR